MEKLIYGAAYYAEYMPAPRADEDMRMMRDAGMNVIRIAESTWATYEPTEGCFDFSSVVYVLDKAEAHGLKVIVGTPTYAVPAWLVKKHPQVMVETKQGVRPYGARQSMDITDPAYLLHAERIIRRLLEVAAPYRCVIGYQIDNETKHYGVCSGRVQQRFVKWLRERFGTLEALNEAYGLNYWSNRIGSWDDFPDVRGTINGSLGAAFEAYERELVSEFLAWQARLVREYARPEQFITHNFDLAWRGHSFGVQPDVAHDQASECLDMAGVDIYHPSQAQLTGREIAFGGDLTRCLKQRPYLVAETQAQGFPQWTPYPGQLRLQAFSHIASGSRGIMYWHWASLHNAIETYWKGVLSHDLLPNAVYREAMTIGADFDRLSDRLCPLTVRNRAALLVSNTALTAMQWFPLPDGRTYNDVVRWLYDACYDINLPVDIIFPQADLSAYELLLVPALYAADDALLRRIAAFVENGGHLIATFKSGFCDEHVKVRAQRQPAMLREVVGASYALFAAPEDVRLSGGGQACGFMELLEAEGAEVLASYTHPAWQAYAAVTRNDHRKGTALYIGCMTDDQTIRRLLLDELARVALSDARQTLSFPLIARGGVGPHGRRVEFLFNDSDEPHAVQWPFADGISLLTGQPLMRGESFSLPAWDFVIVEEAAR